MARATRPSMSRRDVLRYGSAAAALAAIGRVALPSWIVTADAGPSDGPYGPLLPPDANGLRLPVGFTSRFVARSGDLVADTDLAWHGAPDGGACFPTADGYVYVSNSEIDNGQGGVSAIEFDHGGDVVDAYSILEGTHRNCSGGATPWGTWLSCEENGATSLVYECDPLGTDPARARPSMGRFNHEAAVPVFAAGSLAASFIMTEDDPLGRLYRFIPDTWGDLAGGRLQAAHVDENGAVTWVGVASNRPDRSSNTTPFDGGEGLAVHGSDVFIATKGDCRVWRLDMITSTIEVIHDCVAAPNTVLESVDGLLIDEPTGDLFVAQDGPSTDLALISATETGSLELSPFVQFMGHEGSEITGLALNPTRTTLLVSSQRGTDGRGITYAVTGPFRVPGQPPPTTSTTSTTSSTTPDTTTTVPDTSTTAPDSTTTVPDTTTTTVPPTTTTSTSGTTTSTSSTTTSMPAPPTTAPATTAAAATAPPTTRPPTTVGRGLNRPSSSSKLRRATRIPSD